jgi:hypothetical protein
VGGVSNNQNGDLLIMTNFKKLELKIPNKTKQNNHLTLVFTAFHIHLLALSSRSIVGNTARLHLVPFLGMFSSSFDP